VYGEGAWGGGVVKVFLVKCVMDVDIFRKN
jgi:hypothetical protein